MGRQVSPVIYAPCTLVVYSFPVCLTHSTSLVSHLWETQGIIVVLASGQFVNWTVLAVGKTGLADSFIGSSGCGRGT